MKFHDSVLRRVRIIEEKNGIRYAKTDGRLYKTLRVLYSIVGLYTVGINILFLLGMLLMHAGTENFSSVLDSVISVSVCTALIIAGYVLSFFRFKIISAVISIIPQAFLIFSFGRILADDLGYFGFKASFYWRHFAPLILMIVFITWSTIIAVRARMKTEKQYKKVLDNLYSQFNISTESNEFNNISEEQWNEFLKDYDPTDYKKLFKSQQVQDEKVTRETKIEKS